MPDPHQAPPHPADIAPDGSSHLPSIDDPRALLVVPALDEADAIDDLAAVVAAALAGDTFVRAVVVDGGSSDDTVARARAAGLEVLEAADLPPGRPVLGKGDSIWRVASLQPATDRPAWDVVVCRDADVRGVDAEDLAALALAAAAPGVALAKGRFDRLQYEDGPPRPTSGRITEFVARPLLALLADDVGHVAEPLSGQFAIRRDVLAALPIVTRYGVDVGLVLGVARRHGPAAVTQVDVGALVHRAKQDASLVPMAHDVAATILAVTGGALDDVGRPATAAGPGEADADVAMRLPCGGPAGWLVVRPARQQGAARGDGRRDRAAIPGRTQP